MMSVWSRVGNVFRQRRLNREIDAEIQSHIEEAVEQGRDPFEVRRTFGSMLRTGESSRDVRLAAWLDSVCADFVFGWRQIRKHRTASAAAIVSLGLAIGACTAAFRLQVKADDFGMLATPAVTILAAALLAALPPVLRAVRVDKASMLQAD